MVGDKQTRMTVTYWKNTGYQFYTFDSFLQHLLKLFSKYSTPYRLWQVGSGIMGVRLQVNESAHSVSIDYGVPVQVRYT